MKEKMSWNVARMLIRMVANWAIRRGDTTSHRIHIEGTVANLMDFIDEAEKNEAADPEESNGPATIRVR